MVERTDKATVHGFVAAHVAPDAKVYTDDALVYETLPNPHEVVNHSAQEYVPGRCPYQRCGELLVDAEARPQGHLPQDES